MRDVLVWRWIGLHAVAFLLHNFVLWCFYSLIEDVGRFSRSAWSYVLEMISLGVPLAAAQALAFLDRKFPVPAPRWGGANLLGAGLSYMASMFTMTAFIRATSPTRQWSLEALTVLGYVMWIATAVSGGVVLALSYGLAMIGRLPRRDGILWMASVVGAWLLARLASAAPYWLKIVPEGGDRDLAAFTASLVIGALEGAVFGIALWPILRRMLRERPGA